MSRIGNRKLIVPAGVTVEVSESIVTVKGPKGELKENLLTPITVEVVEGVVETKRPNDEKHTKQLHGTMNSLIENMIIGVTDGYSKTLEAVGVGYRFNVSGNKIGINAGFSHPVEEIVPEGLTVSANGNTEITINGINKKKVSDFAAKIRAHRQPEPYKGKGIRYADEHVRRKEGKKAAK